MLEVPIKNRDMPNDFLQELASDMQHSMGAPFRGITQFSRLLNNRSTDPLQDKERHWLELIGQNGAQAQEMMDAIVHLSRLSDTQHSESVFSPRQLIDDVIKQQCARLKSIDYHYTVECAVDELKSCQQHWQTMMSRLINNAFIYQPKAAGHQTIVQVSFTLEDDRLRLQVEDNGLGVSENSLGLLTRPFKRMQAGDDYPGIGMGLSYCKRIAGLQGGCLEFQRSKLGGLLVRYSVNTYAGNPKEWT